VSNEWEMMWQDFICNLRPNLGICQEIQTKITDNFSIRIE